MRVSSLILELTRKCNMKCGHCLRGDAENVDMDVRSILSALKDNGIDEIGHLTLTGGEVSLRPKLVEIVREWIAYCHIDVDSFYVVTNSKKYSKKFAEALERLVWHMSEPSWSVLSLSSSQYHRNEGQDKEGAIMKYSRYFEKNDVEVALELREELKDSQLISEGRAKENQIAYTMKQPEMWDMEIVEDEGIDNLYISALGEVVPSCDLSYASATAKSLGNILTTPLNEMMPVIPHPTSFVAQMASDEELVTEVAG